MVFEVDNTTEKIINDLQTAVDGKINDIKDDNRNVIREISLLKDELSNDEINDNLRKVDRNLLDSFDKIKKLQSQNEEITDGIYKLVSGIDQIKDEEANKEDISEIKKQIESIVLQIEDIKALNIQIKEAIIGFSEEIINTINKVAEDEKIVLSAIDKMTENNNRVYDSTINSSEQLNAISEYLSKPGIARIFKGMK